MSYFNGDGDWLFRWLIPLAAIGAIASVGELVWLLWWIFTNVTLTVS